jgi:hypothetical protein
MLDGGIRLRRCRAFDIGTSYRSVVPAPRAAIRVALDARPDHGPTWLSDTKRRAWLNRSSGRQRVRSIELDR